MPGRVTTLACAGLGSHLVPCTAAVEALQSTDDMAGCGCLRVSKHICSTMHLKHIQFVQIALQTEKTNVKMSMHFVEDTDTDCSLQLLKEGANSR